MEQNLAEIYKNNIIVLTRSLEQYKNELSIFQRKYDMLKEDYQYNLKVIKERDEALRKCDSYISKLVEVWFLNLTYEIVHQAIQEQPRGFPASKFKFTISTIIWLKIKWYLAISSSDESSEGFAK